MLAEKRMLQFCIALACCVPVSAGLAGVMLGLPMLGQAHDISADSHFRYLSGLLLGIGLAFLSCIPRIEDKTSRMRMLTAIVLVGGLARLYSVFADGDPVLAMYLALVMELVVTPLLCAWQSRVVKLSIRA